MRPDAGHGPVRPEHADHDWCFEGDEQRGFLIRRYGKLTAHIRATTATTCAWNVVRTDGRLLREASVRNVEDAKAAVTQWIREHS